MEEKGFRVTGRVQGVGFRWWTRQNAAGLGLEGAVRNRRDGSVEIHVRGPREDVASLRQMLAEGPTAARVDAVEECEPGLGVMPGEFRIVR